MADTVKHTPGPWSVENPMGADIGLSIVQAGLKSYEWTFIAMVQKSEPEDSEEVGRVIGCKEQMANARIIAASPELLECLKDARKHLIDQNEIDLQYIDAVISKAEGRS